MEDDFFLIFIVVLGFLVAASILIVGVAGAIEDQDKEDRFRQACAERGGFVADTGSGWSSRIDCIVDNEVIYLPGFE